MTLPHLRIAYGDEPSQRVDVLSEILRGQGHEVALHATSAEFLSAPEPDLYLIGRSIPDGSGGLELLEALRRTGRSAPVVILESRPSFEDMRRAVELGATDVLLLPLETGELTRAIVRAVSSRTPKPRIDSAPQAHAIERSYTVDPSTVGRAAREISAFLVNEGVASAHRVRIASALAELVDNACRHAYARTQGEVIVRAEVQRTRVQLSVEDSGPGFDAARAKLDQVPAALPGSRNKVGAHHRSSRGLGRVAQLSEDHHVDSGPQGTRVELAFNLTPVRFDEEAEHLAETDFLDPSRARSLIASLRKGQTDLSGVAPAMALTIGRILGGLDAEVRPRSQK